MKLNWNRQKIRKFYVWRFKLFNNVKVNILKGTKLQKLNNLLQKKLKKQ